MKTWYSAYLEADWKFILHQSELQIARETITGDEVLWSKAFFYYGCMALYLQEPHIYQTVYQQVETELSKGISDPRIQAYFHRFLAIHAAFAGKTSIADNHFNRCINAFAETGYWQEEVLSLIEYGGLLLLYTQNWKAYEFLLSRLKRIRDLKQDTKMDPWLYFFHGYKALSLGYPSAPTDLSSNGISTIIIEALALQPNQKEVPLRNSLEIWENSNIIHPIFTPWIQFIYFQEATQKQNQMSIRARLYQLQGVAKTLNHQFWISLSNLLAEKYNEGLSGEEQMIEDENILRAYGGETWFLGLNQPIRQDSETTGTVQELENKISIQGFETLTISNPIKTISQTGWNRKLSRDLLIYMLIQSGGSVSRDRLLDVFFQDESEQKVRNRLYVAIHHLRERFRELLDLQTPVIILKEGAVYLNRAVIDSVDIWDYQKLCSVGNQLWGDDPEAAISLFQKANQLFSPHLFTGIDDLEWLDEFREDLRQKHLKILRRMARYFWRKENDEALEEILTEIIQLDPFHEEGYRLYIMWLLKRNRKSESMIWYDRLYDMLEKHVGVKPSFSIQKIENSNYRGLFDETGTD